MPVVKLSRRLGFYLGGGLFLTAVLVTAAGAVAPGGADSAALGPENPALAQEFASLQAVCAKCHDLEIVMSTPMSSEGWHDTVQKMIDRGAEGTDDQFDDIIDYLHRTMTMINVNSADLEELETVLNVPENVARAIVARRSARRITDLADLKTISGIDASSLDRKARLIFFN